jgi:glycosyltransferase involved in cell wall biosynthesis
MKILFLLQEFPYPPINGMRWKAYNLLDYMAQYHQCDVISFGGLEDLRYSVKWQTRLPGLRVLAIYPLQSGLSLQLKRVWHLMLGNPPSVARWSSRDFGKAVERALESLSYDLVHCDWLNLAQYWPTLAGIPSLLSETDATSMYYHRIASEATNVVRRYLHLFVAHRLRRYESRVFPNFDAIHVVSRVDLEYLQERNPGTWLQLIEIAVDSRFLEIPMEGPDELSRRRKAPVLFSSGLLCVPGIADPLCQFINNELKQVRRVFPNLRYIIIGRGASKEALSVFAQESSVHFTPWVDDYAVSLAAADVVLFLDRTGSGIKNRVLQALAAGRAVVGTPVALEGLAISDRVHACVCDSPSQIAETVVELLRDSEFRLRLGMEARRLVQQLYTKEAIGSRWHRLYSDIINSRQLTTGKLKKFGDQK